MTGEPEAPEVIDFEAGAELYAQQRPGRKSVLFYRRFGTTAEAVRFAVEEMPAGMGNPVLESSDRRFDVAEIRDLYDAETYPLERSARRSPGPRA